MWILSTVDRVFYPLVLYALYLTVGKCLCVLHVRYIQYKMFCKEDILISDVATCIGNLSPQPPDSKG